MTPNTPNNVNSVQWIQAVGYSRQACARVFRDGGSPADALVAFGLETDPDAADWSRAVDLIANTLCKRAMPLAA
jgi:hypothetical protein